MEIDIILFPEQETSKLVTKGQDGKWQLCPEILQNPWENNDSYSNNICLTHLSKTSICGVRSLMTLTNDGHVCLYSRICMAVGYCLPFLTSGRVREPIQKECLTAFPKVFSSISDENWSGHSFDSLEPFGLPLANLSLAKALVGEGRYTRPRPRLSTLRLS